MKRELNETKRRLDTVTGERGKCRGQLHSWARWYAHRRKCCLIASRDRPVGAPEDRAGSGGMPYARRSGTVFWSPTCGGAPSSDREDSVRAAGERDDPDTVPVSPPERS